MYEFCITHITRLRSRRSSRRELINRIRKNIAKNERDRILFVQYLVRIFLHLDTFNTLFRLCFDENEQFKKHFPKNNHVYRLKSGSQKPYIP